MKTNGTMLKAFLISGLLFCLSFSSRADYILNGSASSSGSDCYILTPDEGSQAGAVWSDQPFSLALDFDLTFQVYLGSSDAGADGIAFVIMPSAGGLGAMGGGLGYMGLAPSLAIELDTYTNLDPLEDHIAIQRDGDINPWGTLAGPVQASAINQNIEDGLWHTVQITWDASALTLIIYFDGSQRLTYNADITSMIFGGNPQVYWGFTGATGGARNLQQFCVTSLIFEEAPVVPLSPWALGLAVLLIVGVTAFRFRKSL
jgi:hypothetical protein